MLQEVVVKFENSINSEKISQFNKQTKKLANFLKKEKEIRLFFGYSQNYGHVATTLKIMYRLIELGFDGEIELLEPEKRIIRIIFQDNDYDNRQDPPVFTQADEKQTHAHRISRLVPGLTSEQVKDKSTFTLNKHTILAFHELKVDKMGKEKIVPDLPEKAIKLCVTGAFDYTSNKTEQLKVQYLLSLAPALYNKLEIRNTIYINQENRQEEKLLAPVPASEDSEDSEDSEHKDFIFGKEFHNYAFYVNLDKVSNIENSNFIWKDPEKHKILSVITSLCNNNQILMSPVYYSEGRILCSNDEFLLIPSSRL
ncbi:MAG: hypothetical protein F6K37_24380 [Moorea sp. SIO4E2]|uniref:hypothetical protein n=1 Tax=Moorena sp. SIO4E2 TaxID=2607826 RepID=UPI0013B864F5|nr:hypothetical protein [Moorena sp. SIO4E2]NEQ08964.1 hypothetical protein [Moorena sp. SIO4E2]